MQQLIVLPKQMSLPALGKHVCSRLNLKLGFNS